VIEKIAVSADAQGDERISLHRLLGLDEHVNEGGERAMLRQAVDARA